MWGFFSWKRKEKGPTTRRIRAMLGPLHSLCGYLSLCSLRFLPTSTMHHIDFMANIFWLNCSQGQKHVIQLKNSQELISPNMSSQFQLENSPELIKNGRCQLDDFQKKNSLWVWFGGVPPSPLAVLQASCLDRADLLWSFCITQTDPQKNPKEKCHKGKNLYRPKKCFVAQNQRFPRKCPKSEISLGNVAL